jgi:hypothetical protein
VDGFRRDVGNYASPSGVNRSHSPISLVGNQNRETIGGSDRQADSRQVRDQSIALALKARRFHQ